MEPSDLEARASVNLAAIEYDSVVNGEGLRTVLYTQGCRHCCPKCHNPETWDFNGGTRYSFDQIIAAIEKNKISRRVTWSGGDPVYQEMSVNIINRYLKNAGYNIWLYTGFTYEYLTKYSQILTYVDVLVDGLYVDSLRTLDCIYRGSKNQRIIDVTRSKNRIVYYPQGEAC